MLISFEEAAQTLNNQDIVAIPTETVYGLAARIDSEQALKKIFATKKRPFFDPLIVHISNLEMAKSLVLHWPMAATKLAQAFWPGPLTIILPKNNLLVSDLITSGLPNVGLRMPKHEITLKLIEKIQTPLAAPSANLFGKTSPTNAQHVESEFDQKIATLDGGSCQVGIESTIVYLDESQLAFNILRPGMISKEEILEIIPNYTFQSKLETSSPGDLPFHYQPTIPLFLIPEILSSKDRKLIQSDRIAFLKLSEYPDIAARELYSMLRQYSSDSSFDAIALEYFNTIKDVPAWQAIVNRLTKAGRLLENK